MFHVLQKRTPLAIQLCKSWRVKPCVSLPIFLREPVVYKSVARREKKQQNDPDNPIRVASCPKFLIAPSLVYFVSWFLPLRLSHLGSLLNHYLWYLRAIRIVFAAALQPSSNGICRGNKSHTVWLSVLIIVLLVILPPLVCSPESDPCFIRHAIPLHVAETGCMPLIIESSLYEQAGLSLLPLKGYKNLPIIRTLGCVGCHCM